MTEPLFHKIKDIVAHRVTQREVIHTLEGDMVAEIGDWIITGIKGERYPCKDDIFRESYYPMNWEAMLLWRPESEEATNV